MKDTVCVDFDGVIHSYTSGWTGPVPIDPPVHGAREAIARLRQTFEVHILSTRAMTPEGFGGISDWLVANEIPVDGIHHSKPRAKIYIDDHALRFEGNWKQTLSAALKSDMLHSWNKKRSRKGEVLVLFGYPASGKTTWARARCKEDCEAVRISSDEMIAMSGQPYRGDRQAAIRCGEEAIARNALKGGLTVIVDRTNITVRERERWVLMACEENVPAVAVVFLAPWEDCCERNGKRENAVPQAIMGRMAQKFELPTTDEGFERIQDGEAGDLDA